MARLTFSLSAACYVSSFPYDVVQLHRIVKFDIHLITRAGTVAYYATVSQLPSAALLLSLKCFTISTVRVWVLSYYVSVDSERLLSIMKALMSREGAQ